MNYNTTELRNPSEIMQGVRQTICAKYDLFADAVYQLDPFPEPRLPEVMTTDGNCLYYNPDAISQIYEAHGLEPLMYETLHLASHCLLGHLYMRASAKDTALFDAAADYKVFKLLSSLCNEVRQNKKKLPKNKSLPESKYPLSILLERVSENPKYLEAYYNNAEVLKLDNHEFWYQDISESGLSSQEEWLALGEEFSEKLDSIFYDVAEGTGMDSNDLEWRNQLGNTSDGNSNQSENNNGGKLQGTQEGHKLWHRSCCGGSSLNYKEILKDFLQHTLLEAESILSIDPMWYHYGIENFGDIPLIEPGEEEMLPRAGTLLVAIDTSGSCEQEACSTFLKEMDLIMEELEGMNSMNQVVFFQCDLRIQEELVLRGPEEWKGIVEDFTVRGGGGTDFNPVFEAGEYYQDVTGLIYLSDGYGDFPQDPTPYPTLFLLTEELSKEDFKRLIPHWVSTTLIE